MSALGDPLTLNVNYTPVASAIATGQRFQFHEVTAGTNTEIDTVDATTLDDSIHEHDGNPEPAAACTTCSCLEAPPRRSAHCASTDEKARRCGLPPTGTAAAHG